MAAFGTGMTAKTTPQADSRHSPIIPFNIKTYNEQNSKLFITQIEAREMRQAIAATCRRVWFYPLS
jgi:ornithine cyclodeaminase/alanine dehydrogenase-like protein (mu-crystallin family)